MSAPRGKGKEEFREELTYAIGEGGRKKNMMGGIKKRRGGKNGR